MGTPSELGPGHASGSDSRKRITDPTFQDAACSVSQTSWQADHSFPVCSQRSRLAGIPFLWEGFAEPGICMILAQGKLHLHLLYFFVSMCTSP